MAENNELTLQQAISAIQSNMHSVLEMSGRNSMYKSSDGKYFTESDVYAILKPLMEKYGLTAWIEAKDESKAEIKYIEHQKSWSYQREGYLIVSKTTTQKVRDEERNVVEKIQIPIDIIGAHNEYQKCRGTAMTYTQKYELAKLFWLSTDELDADVEQPKNKEQAKTTPKSSPQEQLTGSPIHDQLRKIVNEPKNKGWREKSCSCNGIWWL